MGIIRSNAVLYLEARARGVSFRRTLTLGRQRFYVTSAESRALAERFRPDLTGTVANLRFGAHADDFLKQFLGVESLETLDHSTYEGASIAHDLNTPIPAHLHEQYDAVIDSGTLEHVFNLPVAIASCMQLVKPGGTLFLSTPANNMCGHGFYQISPELYFRLFKDANGFSLTRLVMVTHPFPGAELSERQTWYDVRDPAEIGARAPLMTKTPAFLMVEAKRVERMPILAAPPLQSDYVTAWNRPAETSTDRSAEAVASTDRSAEAFALPGGRIRDLKRRLFSWLPARLRALAIGWYQRAYLCTLRNRRAFHRLD